MDAVTVAGARGARPSTGTNTTDRRNPDRPGARLNKAAMAHEVKRDRGPWLQTHWGKLSRMMSFEGSPVPPPGERRHESLKMLRRDPRSGSRTSTGRRRCRFPRSLRCGGRCTSIERFVRRRPREECADLLHPKKRPRLAMMTEWMPGAFGGRPLTVPSARAGGAAICTEANRAGARATGPRRRPRGALRGASSAVRETGRSPLSSARNVGRADIHAIFTLARGPTPRSRAVLLGVEDGGMEPPQRLSRAMLRRPTAPRGRTRDG